MLHYNIHRAGEKSRYIFVNNYANLSTETFNSFGRLQVKDEGCGYGYMGMGTYPPKCAGIPEIGKSFRLDPRSYDMHV